VISGICRGINEIFFLLGCYAVLIGIYLSTFRDGLSVTSSRNTEDGTDTPLKMGLICCPETSVSNYQSTLRNIPEDRRC